MRILFSMRHTGALRNFASTLQALAERNHQVHLVFGHRDKEGDERLLSKLTHDFPTITAGKIAENATDYSLNNTVKQRGSLHR